ncbi:MAG: hypothetical protein RRA94_05040 [Bacteroidota bacterium]|nr:hypothetical protein [Bacteroidota bacterium]
MNTCRYFLPALLFVLILWQVPAHAGEPGREVALVTSVAGAATLRSGGEEAALTLGMQLREGDVVVVTGGNVALVFLTGEYLALKAGDQLTLGSTLGESTLTEAGGTRGLGPDDGMTVAADGVDAGQDDDFWQAQLASVSGIRADAALIAVSPRLTLSDPNPLFCWFDTDTAAGMTERSYRIVLRDSHYETIAEQEVRGRPGQLCCYRFASSPRGFHPSPRRHYSWTILPLDVVPARGILDAVFVYVDEAGLEDARAHAAGLQRMLEVGSIDRSSLHMLLSRYYLDERERLFADAVQHLRAVDSLAGGSPYARQELARMFLRFGNQVSTLAPRILRRDTPIGGE